MTELEGTNSNSIHNCLLFIPSVKNLVFMDRKATVKFGWSVPSKKFTMQRFCKALPAESNLKTNRTKYSSTPLPYLVNWNRAAKNKMLKQKNDFKKTKTLSYISVSLCITKKLQTQSNPPSSPPHWMIELQPLKKITFITSLYFLFLFSNGKFNFLVFF